MISSILVTYNSENTIIENYIYFKGIHDNIPSNNFYCVNNTGNYYFDGAEGPICVIDCFNDSDCDGDVNRVVVSSI